MQLEELARGEVEHRGDQVGREGRHPGVVGAHVAVVEAPGRRDPVLGVGQLVLQVEEVRARLQVRVGLDPDQQVGCSAPPRASSYCPRPRGSSLLCARRRLAGPGHGVEDRALVRGVPLHGLDEVRDQVVPTGELDVDAAPRLVDQRALPDEAVVHHDQATSRSRSGAAGEHGDGGGGHAADLPPRTWRQTNSGTLSMHRVDEGQRGVDLRRGRRWPLLHRRASSRRSKRQPTSGCAQQELHHPRVQDVRGELPVRAGHGERPVEVLGLELDVAVGEPAEQAAERCSRGSRSSAGNDAPSADSATHREAWVVVAPVLRRSRWSGLVLVVERHERAAVVLAAQRRCWPTAVAEAERRALGSASVERVVAARRRSSPARRRTPPSPRVASWPRAQPSDAERRPRAATKPTKTKSSGAEFTGDRVGAAAQVAGELRRALLGEGPRALLGVVGREDRGADRGVVLPAVVLVLALGVAHRPEDRLDRERAVGGDQVGDLVRLLQRLCRRGRRDRSGRSPWPPGP